MKRFTWLLLLAAPLVGQGCLGMEKMLDERPVAAIEEPDKTPAPDKQASVVSADNVTAENAVQVTAALSAELDRAATEPVAQPVTAHVQPR